MNENLRQQILFNKRNAKKKKTKKTKQKQKYILEAQNT